MAHRFGMVRESTERSLQSNKAAIVPIVADQLVANYVPAFPGWWATNDLLHADYL